MLLHSGTKINGPLKIGEVVYPMNWWDTEAHRALHGVTVAADPVRPDDALYIVAENADGTYSSAPRPLLELQTRQLGILSTACRDSIYAGFDSSALGAPHHYPALDKDQSNLAGSVLASILPGVDPAAWTTPFICADTTGVWQHRVHTAVQIQQVGTDAKAAIVAAVIKNATLAAQVMAAPDMLAVLAVTWASI